MNSNFRIELETVILISAIKQHSYQYRVFFNILYYHREEKMKRFFTISLLVVSLLSSYNALQSQWVFQNSDTGDHLWGVHFISNNVGWAVGGQGGVPIRKTIDGGKTWTAQWAGTSSWLLDVSFANATNGWIVGDAGTILSTTNGGSLWTKDSSGITNKLSGVKAISQYRAIAVGNDGKILLKRNQFSNWVQINSGVSTTLHRVAFSNQNNGCIVGTNGVVLLTTDGGETWSKKSIGYTLPLNSVAFADVNNVVIVGANGLVLTSVNGGNTWVASIITGEPDLRCISYPTVAKAYISGNDNIFTSKDSCKTFTKRPSGTSWLLGSSFPSQDTGYFVGHGGKILKTSTGGLGNTITLQNMQLSYCQGEIFNLSFSVFGEFQSGNTFSIQLSNKIGSFTSPTTIGTLKSDKPAIVNCTIPANTVSGSGYRIRVVGSSPSTLGADNGTDISINILPRPKIVGSATSCLNNMVTQFSIQPIPRSFYKWFPISNGTILGRDDSSTVEVLWKNSGIDTLKVRVTDSNSGCVGDTNLVVTIHPAPNTRISGKQAACISVTPTDYSVDMNTGNQYTWQQPKLGIIVGASNSNTVNIRWRNVGIDTLLVRERSIVTGCSKDTFIIVTVLPQPQPKINGDTVVQEQSQGIVYSVQQEIGSSYEWSIVSGNASINAKSGNIAVLNFDKQGIVILKVIQTNVDGCINESQIVITVKAPTSVQDESHLMFTVYPNPTEASDELLVQIADLHTRVLQIELVDVMGVSMVKTAIEPNNGIIPLNIHGITSGMYIVRVHTPNGILSEKVIVN